jgi:hypothetical protein
MSFPSSAQFIGWSYKQSLRGNRATAKYSCAAADENATASCLIGAYWAGDLTIMCDEVGHDYLNADAGNGQIVLAANFVPFWTVIDLLPNSPFRVGLEWGEESYTLPLNVTSPAVKWSDGTAIDPTVAPPVRLILKVCDIVLTGTRTGINPSTYASYEDNLNSDTFLGMAPKKVSFLGASAKPRMLDDGTMTFDVEVRLRARNVEWDKFPRSDAGTGSLWQTAVLAGGGPLIPTTAFTPILS